MAFLRLQSQYLRQFCIVAAVAVSVAARAADAPGLCLVNSGTRVSNGILLNSQGDIAIPFRGDDASSLHVDFGGITYRVSSVKSRPDYGLSFISIHPEKPCAYARFSVRQPAPGASLSLIGMMAGGRRIACPVTLLGIRRRLPEQRVSGSYYEVAATAPCPPEGAALTDTASGEVYGILTGLHGEKGCRYVLFGEDIGARAAMAHLCLGSVTAADAPSLSLADGHKLSVTPRCLDLYSASAERPGPALEQARSDWSAYSGCTPDAFTSPVPMENSFYFGTGQGTVFSVDSKTMQRVWMTPNEMPVLFPPSVSSRYVCVGLGSLNLEASPDPKVKSALTQVERAAGRYDSIADVITKGLGLRHTVRHMSDTGIVRCLDRETGVLKWEYDTRFIGAPRIAGDYVVYGGLQTLGALTLSRGRVVWEKLSDHKSSDLDYYVVGDADSSRVWAYSMPIQLTGGTNANREIDPLRLTPGRGPARMECYSLATGRPIWSAPSSVDPGGPPLCGTVSVSADRKLCFGASAHSLFALNADSGRPLWKRRLFSHQFGGSLSSFGSTVYATGDDNRLYALNAADGRLRWMFDQAREPLSAPQEQDGRVYVGSQDSWIYALDAVTGKVLWKYQAGGKICGQPHVQNGKLFCMTDAGQITELTLPKQ